MKPRSAPSHSSPPSKGSGANPAAREAADIVFRNAVIYDGTGAAPQRGHLVVQGERIADLLPLEAPTPSGRWEIDARGLALAPGFIDVHAHSDYTVLFAPESRSKIAQGITTEIIGNCGFSAFPLRGALADDERSLQARLELDFSWSSAEGYFRRLREARPAVNIASFVGHRNVRGSVMGFADRRPTPDELRAMADEIEQALEAGALGWSTGLIYMPGLFAETDELVELARIAARRQALYASHVRGEGDRLLSAAAEFFEIVDRSATAAQYSHLKASGRRNWGKVEKVIEQIEKRVSAGMQLAFDRYPYTASSTELSSLLPRWVVEGGREQALARLASPETRARIANELLDDFGEDLPWNDILLADIPAREFAAYRGWRLSAIAEHLRTDPLELFFELLRAGRLDTWMCHFTMSEADMQRVLTHPLCMVCTDAESRATGGLLAEGAPHPRGFGAFPRFIQHFVRERRLLSLQEAVRKMTSLPATVFGLEKRGRLAPGFAADLVLFDPDTICDPCVYGAAPAYPHGIQTVVVNGIITFHEGHFTGERAGQVLLRKSS